METNTAEILNRAIRHFEEGLTALKLLRSQTPEIPAKTTVTDLEKRFKKLLYNTNWPVASEEAYRCDPQCDHDKINRAHAILDHIIDCSIEDVKFLDYGCGEGHLAFAASERGARLSVGLDCCRQGWGIFPDKPDFNLTTNKHYLQDKGPFDIVVAYDVFDHMTKENAVSELQFLTENLAENGKLFLRMHPWTSRTAAHKLYSLNKAYVQLFFSSDELAKMGINANVWRVVNPLETYKDWLGNMGLNIVREKLIFSEVPGIMKTPVMIDRMKKMYDVDPKCLVYNYVDYTLTK